jgi:hypothetical protein
MTVPHMFAILGAAGAGGGEDFPTDNLQLWLDASDTATITDAGGGAVSAWADKSAAGDDVSQGTSGARPVTGTTTQNSLNTIDFDGTDDALATSGFNFDPTNRAVTIAMVVKWDTVNVDAAGFFDMNNSGGLDINNFILERRTGPTRIQMVYGVGGGGFAGGNFRERYFADTDTTNYHVLVVRVDTTAERMRYDGVTQTLTNGGGTLTQANFWQTQPSNKNFTIGDRPGQFHLNGKIGEVLVWDAALSDGDITDVETYLQDKWGL